jgi:hypothetical protein
MSELPQNRYKCVHCGKVLRRRSKKQWVKSLCSKIGRDVHLQLVKGGEG